MPLPLTPAERQARRRDMHRRMKAALQAITQARTVREARALAEEALDPDRYGAVSAQHVRDAVRRRA